MPDSDQALLTPHEDGTPENLRAQLRERDARIEALETELGQMKAGEAAARSRRRKAVTFAGEVATGAVVGSEVKGAAREAWDAWDAYLQDRTARPVPKTETRELVVSVLSRLTRLRLIYVLLAVVPSVLILLQVVLLAQQNQRIDRQNNLIAFEQTSALRSLLFLPPYDTLGQVVENYFTVPDTLLYSDSLYRWPQPNASTVEQIVSFGERELAIVAQALHPLVQDNAPPVAIGALQALSSLRQSGVLLDSINARGGRFPNADLAGADLTGVDLFSADLSGADLFSVDLTGGDLFGADLSSAYLLRANLSGAVLWDADLSDAFLARADLSGADLSGADLAGADLTGADLAGAGLTDADLTGANLAGADLAGAGLAGAVVRQLNIFCIQNAPHGFIEWALRNGATVNSSDRVRLERAHGLSCPD